MKSPDFYKDNIQTYTKHFFLEKYLERVAYNNLSTWNDFVYVDGFSGPWKSEDEAFEDTSFMIAINQLRKVRDGINKQTGRNVKIRCFFNDKSRSAFEDLERAVANIEDIDIKVACSAFEDAIPEITQYIGNSFSLTFIDPTGWRDYALKKIQPLLSLRGEVMINFMYDFVNRFLNDSRPEIASSFDNQLGSRKSIDSIEKRMAEGMTREEAILDEYRAQLRGVGKFDHVTTTRILKPLTDRSYFHLVYATRHLKGLIEFRKVEKKAVEEQERVRGAAKMDSREKQTGMADLFANGADQTGPRSYEAERSNQLRIGREKLTNHLGCRGSEQYENLLGLLLEMPLVWQTDINKWLHEMRKAGQIEIPNISGRKRVPEPLGTIIWRGANQDKP